VRLVRERPDQFVRYAWLGMWPFAMAGLILGFGPLIAASGVVITLVGVLMVTDYRSVLERLTDHYRDSWMTWMQSKAGFTRFQGGVTVAIGLIWVTIGLVVALT
jgi:hypothetical protein